MQVEKKIIDYFNIILKNFIQLI